LHPSLVPTGHRNVFARRVVIHRENGLPRDTRSQPAFIEDIEMRDAPDITRRRFAEPRRYPLRRAHQYRVFIFQEGARS
jgi:hypothetical protein